MKLEIEVFGALCHLSKFKINTIQADEDDFVDKYDHASKDAPEYGCGNMQADIIPPTKEILTKYNITEAEYYEIAAQVSEKLSFGKCGWCI